MQFTGSFKNCVFLTDDTETCFCCIFKAVFLAEKVVFLGFLQSGSVKWSAEWSEKLETNDKAGKIIENLDRANVKHKIYCIFITINFENIEL